MRKCIWLILLFCLFLIPAAPLEPCDEDPPEDDDMVTYGKFDTVAMTNGMEDIRDMRNIGFGYSDHWDDLVYWWAKTVDDYLNIYSAPDFETTKYEEHSVYFPHDTPVTNISVSTTILRISGTKLYVGIGANYTFSGTDYVEFYMRYTDNFTVAAPDWHFRLGFIDAATISSYEVLDFAFTDPVNLIFTAEVGAGLHQLFALDSAGDLDSENILNYEHVWAGWNDPVGGNYFMVYEESSNVFKITEYDGVAFADIETITITKPSNWNVAYQQYWNQDGKELLIDLDYKRERTSPSSDFIELAASSAPSTAVVFIWSVDQLRINSVIWDLFIWEWVKGGGIVQGQTYTGNAYVGHRNWFTDGTDAFVFQIETINWPEHTISRRLFEAPRITLRGFLLTFENQYLHTYGLNDAQLAEFFILLSSKGDLPFTYSCLSGVSMDLKQIVNETYAAKSINFMVKDLLATYASHLWNGRGTNGGVLTFDSGLTDWEIVDVENGISSYLAQKTFLNSHTGKNEIFEHVAHQSDPDNISSGYLRKQSTNYTVFSIWGVSNTVAVDSINMIFREGGATKFRLVFDNAAGGTIRLVGTATTIISAYVANSAYHVAVVCNATANTVNVWVNGVEEQINLAVTAFTQMNRIDLQTIISQICEVDLINPYFGDSIDDAMNTLDSISPFLTTTYSITFANKSLRDCFYLLGALAGFIPSQRPDNQLYLDQYSQSGTILVDANYTFIGDPVVKELAPSIIAVHYNGGVKFAYGTGNGGIMHYRFAELDAANAQLTADQLLLDNNVTVTFYEVGVEGKMLNEGTWAITTITKHGVSAQKMYITEVVKYNAFGIGLRIRLADKFWSPFLENRIDDLYQMVENVR